MSGTGNSSQNEMQAQKIAAAMAAAGGGARAGLPSRKDYSQKSVILMVVLVAILLLIIIVKLAGNADQTIYDTEAAAPEVSEVSTETSEKTSTTSGSDAITEPRQGQLPEMEYILVDAPSKNISCEIYNDRIGCSIAERYYQEMGQQDCPDRLFSIQVDSTGVNRQCGVEYLGRVGDRLTTLQYGTSIMSPNRKYKCSIAESGMTCLNTVTGHGFKLARREQSVF